MKNNSKKILGCPICKRQKFKKFFAMPGYRLAKCLSCNMVWDFLPSDNLTRQYSKDYFLNENSKGGYANYFEGMSINKKTFSNRLKKIEKKTKKRGKLLDVGCALGDCLVEAKRLGWKNMEGLEVSNYAFEHARKRGVKVKKGSLNNNVFPANSFDVVSYQDVIEHVVDPIDELKRVYNILKPGGVVFIVTPDVGGILSKLLGRYWYHYKPGEHVVYFSQNTIRKALKKAGFASIETKRTHHILSVEYIVNRFRYYSSLFEYLLRVIKKMPFRDFPITLYTGETEAWGFKS